MVKERDEVQRKREESENWTSYLEAGPQNEKNLQTTTASNGKRKNPNKNKKQNKKQNKTKKQKTNKTTTKKKLSESKNNR